MHGTRIGAATSDSESIGLARLTTTAQVGAAERGMAPGGNYVRMSHTGRLTRAAPRGGWCRENLSKLFARRAGRSPGVSTAQHPRLHGNDYEHGERSSACSWPTLLIGLQGDAARGAEQHAAEDAMQNAHTPSRLVRQRHVLRHANPFTLRRPRGASASCCALVCWPFIS